MNACFEMTTAVSFLVLEKSMAFLLILLLWSTFLYDFPPFCCPDASRIRRRNKHIFHFGGGRMDTVDQDSSGVKTESLLEVGSTENVEEPCWEVPILDTSNANTDISTSQVDKEDSLHNSKSDEDNEDAGGMESEIDEPDECGIDGAHSEILRRVLKTARNPFTCKDCNFKSYQAEIFNDHLQLHEGKKPFKCSQCTYVCNEKGNFGRHLRTHSGERPFSCQECNFKSAEKGTLTRHLITHSGQKPFQCPECSFKCYQEGNLKSHLRTHTGEKPFACSECAYICSEKGNLRRHLRAHLGQKPFSCPQCSFTFADQGNLIKHIRTHTGEKPYLCSKCNYKGSEKRNLNRHYLRVHLNIKPKESVRKRKKKT